MEDLFILHHALYVSDSHQSRVEESEKLSQESSQGDVYVQECLLNHDKYAPFNPWRSHLGSPWNTDIFNFEHIEPIENCLEHGFSCELTRYLDSTLLMEDSPTDWWTPYEDMLLVRGVAHIGWPNNRHRYNALRKYVVQHKMGYLSRGPLEVSPEFKRDLLHGGNGYSIDETSDTSTSQTELELWPPNIKADIMKRLKEIIFLLDNKNPHEMSLNQRQKGSFSNAVILNLGRYGKPVDLDDNKREDDEFTTNELSCVEFAGRIGCKIVRRSEVVKVAAAVEAHTSRPSSDDCSHPVSSLKSSYLFILLCSFFCEILISFRPCSHQCFLFCVVAVYPFTH